MKDMREQILRALKTVSDLFENPYLREIDVKCYRAARHDGYLQVSVKPNFADGVRTKEQAYSASIMGNAIPYSATMSVDAPTPREALNELAKAISKLY